MRTVSSTRSAASATFSCSQMRITVQPASTRAESAARSRLTLVSSFLRHQSPLVWGEVPCSGQRCQKQPSTKTATRDRRNTRSGRIRPIWGRSMFTRYRSPLRYSSCRMAISGAVLLFLTRLIWADLVREGGVGGMSCSGYRGFCHRPALYSLKSNNVNVIITRDCGW